MYPLDDPHLPLYRLAPLWADTLRPKLNADEVLNTFLRDFWRGELQAFVQAADDANCDDRIRLLNACLIPADHPGLLLVRPGEAPPPETRPRPDGSIEVDLRKRVVWTIGGGEPEPALFVRACAALAGARVADYADLVRVGVESLEVRRADFAAYCRRNGWPLPEFWFARRTTPSRVRAETACRDWLRAQVRAGPKRMSKPEYRELARREIGNLSKRQFDRCWEDDRVVPKSWKRVGRLPNSVRKSARQPR